MKCALRCTVANSENLNQYASNAWVAEPVGSLEAFCRPSVRERRASRRSIDPGDQEARALALQALNALMERHSGQVFQFLYRMLANEQDANDLAQETFVRVYRHRAI
jgi:hypothetical protein